MANIDCINVSLPFQVIESQLVACNYMGEGEGKRKSDFSVSVLNYKNTTFEFILGHCVFLKLVWFFFLLLSHISLVMTKIFTKSHFKY